jgi:hypothetical protein
VASIVEPFVAVRINIMRAGNTAVLHVGIRLGENNVRPPSAPAPLIPAPKVPVPTASEAAAAVA